MIIYVRICWLLVAIALLYCDICKDRRVIGCLYDVTILRWQGQDGTYNIMSPPTIVYVVNVPDRMMLLFRSPVCDLRVWRMHDEIEDRDPHKVVGTSGLPGSQRRFLLINSLDIEHDVVHDW